MSGHNAIIIYSVCLLLLHLFSTIHAQEYLGCFKDTRRDRILPYFQQPNQGSSNTVDSCISRCRQRTSTYAGVENTNECFCGDSHDYRRHGRANESDCNDACPGNSTQFCGARGRANVYTVCPRGKYRNEAGQSGNCDFSCHCKDKAVCLYGNGSCPGSCAPGWTGRSCELINCEESQCEQLCEDGQREDACRCGLGYNKKGFICDDINECENPDSHNCSDICVNTNGSYYCNCHSGYELVEGELFKCTDTNECESQDNHKCSDNCVNTVGSYYCECHSGFEFVEGEVFECIDIDECHSNEQGCDQNCTNTHGSHVCSCFDGYEMEEGPNSLCKERESPGSSSDTVASVAGGVSAVVVIIGVIIIVVVVTKRRRKSSQKTNEKIESEDGKGDADNESQLGSGSRSSSETNVSEEEDPQAATSHSQVSVKVSCSTELTNFILLDKLCGYIENIRKSRIRIQEEYEDVRVSYGSVEKAKDEALKLKNKYRNILPYDHNAVKLSETDDPHSDYINASFIRFDGETETVIAAQGPTPKAVNDFWRMVWEYDVQVIAMLANCVEGKKTKCAQYWPGKKQKQYGKVTVVLDEERKYPTHTIRTMTVNHNDAMETRIVRQFHFTSWPDKGVPDHVAPFMSFHGKVQKAAVPGRLTVIHCSAGVGRTGTFVAFGRLLRQAKSEGGVDFLKCLHQMREQRMQMIQTLDQYIFLHAAVMDGVAVGDTALQVVEFSALYSNLQTSSSPVDTSYVTAQYKVLSLMSFLPHELASAGHNQNNKMKNRTDILPADQYRVRLMSVPSDYINAVSIVGYKNTDKYIVTQWPLKNTVDDLWRMIYDYSIEAVIVLEDMTNRESYPAFLPTTGNDVRFGKMFVILDGETTQHGISTGFIRISSNQRSGVEATYANTQPSVEEKDNQTKEKQLRVFQAETVDGNQTLQLDRVISLQNEAESFKTSASSILLISRDGGSLCGQYLALSMSQKMAKEENIIDFFCIVQQIKSRRPEFFNTEESYQALFEEASKFFN